MRSFEIYFNNLNEKAQKEYLAFQEVSDPSELNHEVSPIAIVDREDNPKSSKESLALN
jgi:hypothetical protein